jgi:hypothetical protein
VTVLVPVVDPLLLDPLLVEPVVGVVPVEPELADAGLVTDGADCDLKPSSSTSTATVLLAARMTRRMEVSNSQRVRR